MAYSFIELSGNNGQSSFTFPFDYLSVDHLTVYIDAILTTAWSLQSNYVVTLDTPLVGAHDVRIVRATPLDLPVVDYSNGSVLGESDLDATALQSLYIAQEITDLAESAITLNAAGLYDVGNTQIINLSTPVDANDAATKAYVDDRSLVTGSTIITLNSNTTTLVNSTITNANTVSGNVANITNANTVSGNVVNITNANVLGNVTGNVIVSQSFYEALTGTATIGSNTRTCALSGASFTVTLNTAVGKAGQLITFLHLGTSLTQVYTIDGAGTETVDGTTTYILYTNGERLTIVSDGTNWQIMEHSASTAWANSGALTITATAVNPVKADSANTPIDMSAWRREGDQCYLRYDYTWASNVATATDGTGDYLINLPTGLTIATPTPHRANTTVFAATSFAGILSAAIPTSGVIARDNSYVDSVIGSVYDATRIRLMGTPNYTAIWGSNMTALKGPTAWPTLRTENFEVRFTHANWRK